MTPCLPVQLDMPVMADQSQQRWGGSLLPAYKPPLPGVSSFLLSSPVEDFFNMSSADFGIYCSTNHRPSCKVESQMQYNSLFVERLLANGGT